jgi:O-antigen/teichoic acid export membrane protein
MFLSTAVLAVNRSGRLASAKIVSVIVTTALIFVLVPICQKHFANGGLGVAYAMVVGESLMIGVSWVLIREAIDRRTMSDMARALVAGVATVVLFKLLPPITPFLAIPLCVLVFAGLSWAVGAIQKSDFDLLLASFRKRSPAP